MLKEPGTDIRSSVTGGTTLVSDRLVIRVTTDPGETFLDRMIALVEGAKRQRTPNEIALAILLAGLTIVFLMATVTLRPFGEYAGTTVETVALVALLVCLIPTTIGGLLSAIGIAGMDRVARFNVLAMSGRAVEASGRRRRHPARQDRHDHLRQPARRVDHRRARRDRGGGRRRPPWCRRSGTRRPRAARSSSSPASGSRELGRPAGVGDDAGVRGPRRDHRRGDRRSGPRPARAGSRLTAGTTVLKGAVDAIAKKVGDRARRRSRTRRTGSPTSGRRRW